MSIAAQLIKRSVARIAMLEVALAECHPDDQRGRASIQRQLDDERRLLDEKRKQK